MPDVTAGYGKLSDLKTLFWEFPNIITYLNRYIFIKLAQIVFKKGIQTKV